MNFSFARLDEPAPHQVEAAAFVMALRARGIRVFGLIVPDILASFFTAIARGVEDVAYANGFSVMLSNSDGDPAKEAEYLRTLRTERVMGVILGPTEKANEEARTVLRAGIPLVTIEDRKSVV